MKYLSYPNIAARVWVILSVATSIKAFQTNPTLPPSKFLSQTRILPTQLWHLPSIDEKCCASWQLYMQPVSFNLNNDEKNEDEKKEMSNHSLSESFEEGDINAHEKEMKKLAKAEKRLKNKIKVTVAGASLLAASLGLIALSGPGAWRYYLAGGICAAFSHTAATPVDVIKTRKQLDESIKDLSMVKAAIKIMKDDGGPNALLAGLGPTTVGYLIEGAVKFGIYEVSKPIVALMLSWAATMSNFSFIKSKLLGFVICGGIAGTAASIMLCPMEALRIRLVAEPELGSNGWVEGGLTMVKKEGIEGFFKSLPAQLYKQIPYTVTKNVSFDIFTTMSYSTLAALGADICHKWKVIIPLVSAMLASILSCISSQPGDMLLSVMNAEKGSKTTSDFAHEIMKENGIPGFFVGIRERFLHVGMIVTIQLFIYDFIKRLVGIAPTGL